MVQKLDYYRKIKTKLERRDAQLITAMKAYDEMYHEEWALPVEMQQLGWIRGNPSSDPHDAIDAGVRTLSSLTPGVKITPTLNNEETKQFVNEIEKNLKWQLKAANNRRGRKVEADVVQSALLYMSTCVTVTDLEWQMSVIKAAGGDTSDIEQLRDVSRFLVEVHNPKDVRVLRNRYGVSGVLLTVEMSADEIAGNWGMLNDKRFRDAVEAGETLIYNDWMDRKDRVVWVEPKGGSTDAIELARKAHGLPFIFWVAGHGSTDLEQEEHEKYHPMLYSIFKTGQWDTQNIVNSLYISEVISKASQPDFVEEGSNPDTIEIDYTDPTRHAKAPPGNTIRQLAKQGIDPGLREVSDRMAGAISKSTISQILMGGGLPSGAAFSSLNLATQTALGSLKPARELAEQTLAQIFILMIRWINFTGKSLLGYGIGKEDEGKQYVMDADIDPSTLYLSVELKPDVPTDRLQRANAANMMRNLGYPMEKALEELGVDDPQETLYQYYLENFVQDQFQQALEAKRTQMQQELQLQFEQARMQLQLQFQQAQMQMQLGMQQQGQEQQLAQQQEAQMQQQYQQQQEYEFQARQAQEQQQLQAQMLAQQQQGAGTGMFPGGQGFNPAMGGIPTAQAFPSATREQITGEDQGGNPLAEV